MNYYLRSAEKHDFSTIRQLIREGGINPLGLNWRRFILAVDSSGLIIGCGQLKPHGEGVIELASIATRKGWERRGIAHTIIKTLMGRATPPLWLMCEGSLSTLYARFGFVEITDSAVMPSYFRRMSWVAHRLMPFLKTKNRLAIMVWRG